MNFTALQQFFFKTIKFLYFFKFNFKDESNGNIVSDGRIDAAFRKINKNAVGLHIWKIENDRVEAVPRNQYGIFQDENCYIIYAASLKGTFVNQETIVSFF